MKSFSFSLKTLFHIFMVQVSDGEFFSFDENICLYFAFINE